MIMNGMLNPLLSDPVQLKIETNCLLYSAKYESYGTKNLLEYVFPKIKLI